MDSVTKSNLVEKYSELSVRKQCELLDLSRSSLYYSPVGLRKEQIDLMNEIDLIYTEIPFYGYRKVWQELLNRGFHIGRDRTLKYMQLMGLEAIYPKPKTSIGNLEHRIFPYLLKNLKIEKPNQVWSTDITYIRMSGGFCYLVAVIDWFSRAILSYKLSNTMTIDFCIQALEEALCKYPKPEIFNSDQGSQFTSNNFTKLLLERDVKVSMDGKGRAIDNIMIERFWRSIKYEDIYIKNYLSLKEARSGIASYIDFYNNKRLHAALDYKVPFSVYFN